MENESTTQLSDEMKKWIENVKEEIYKPLHPAVEAFRKLLCD